jgi:hypothetical protein
MRTRILAIAACAPVFLGGCAIKQAIKQTWTVDEGTSPALPKGYGFLAIATDSMGEMNEMILEGEDGQHEVLVYEDPLYSGPSGRSVKIMVVRQGRYCVKQFAFHNMGYRYEHPTSGKCFNVTAGRLNYPGTLHALWSGNTTTERADRVTTWWYWRYEPLKLGELMKKHYPTLLKARRLEIPGIMGDQVIHITGSNEH